MGHFSQNPCNSGSCVRFHSHDASEEVGTACKTECTTTTIMMPSCAKKLQANPLIPVGVIHFLLFVTAVKTLWEEQVSILRAC